MEYDNKPCCAAEALRRIRQIPVKGIPIGICMLDECIAEVKTQEMTSDQEIRAALLKRIKVYNYVPPNVEEEYACALVEEFRKSSVKI
ncbi:MAG: hypothetical protein WC379_13265 [Methanoregula sp.]|jgi:hypothetical protein